MSKVGRSLVVKMSIEEIALIETARIFAYKELAIRHFVKNEGMSEEEALSRVEVGETVYKVERSEEEMEFVTSVEVDVFVKEASLPKTDCCERPTEKTLES